MRVTFTHEAAEIIEVFNQFRTECADMALGDMEAILGLLGYGQPETVAAAFAFEDRRGDIAFDPLGQVRDDPRTAHADDIVVQFTWVVSAGDPAWDRLVRFHADTEADSRAARRAAAERKLAEAQAELDALD